MFQEFINGLIIYGKGKRKDMELYKIIRDIKKIAEFLQKLAPCIERGDLDTCVEEAARGR
ncbi:MAG: hypothetical protein WA144_05745 [Candidatus Methanoperedens sp.]